MKKVFAMVAVAGMMFAGTAHAQNRLAINFGYAPETITGTVLDKDASSTLNGFFVGASYNKNLSGDINVSIGADVRYNTKSEEKKFALVTTDVTSTQIVLDIPVLFNYGFHLKRDFTIAPFIGPTFSYAFSGKDKYENAITLPGLTLNGDNEYDWYGDDGKYKPFNIYGTLGVCINITDFRLYGGYNMGFLNLVDDDDITRKANNWFIGFSYML